MSAEPNTHTEIDHELCGEPVEIVDGRATVAFEGIDRMRVDAHGLVHGGFVFGLADHAAMLAVDDPNVVLGSADVRFTAPVTVGDRVTATAEVVEADGKRRVIEVSAETDGDEVLQGTMTAFVPDSHILDN